MSCLIDSMLSLKPDQLDSLLAGMSEDQLKAIVYDWSIWGRPEQQLPGGDWLTWLILAGRGWGKTRTGAESVRSWACGSTPLGKSTYGRIALVAETAADARDVLVEGPSGILETHPKDFRPSYEPSKRRLTWPNGATATIYNATEPDQLRGPQHEAAWCDELAKWAYARETWDQLQFGLRLGRMPRSIVTTTPRPIPVLKEILGEDGTFVTKGSTLDNRDNLNRKFLERIQKKHSGTRLGRQELDAEILDDLPGALWVRSMFDPPDGSPIRGRVRAEKLPELVRVVVAVDPSGTNGKSDDGDSIGIVVAGVDEAGHGYVLADRSLKEGPNGWARAAIRAYHFYKADRLVGESNFGGAMVESTIRSVDADVSYKAVHASRGKVLRAEPVSALYEQGRVSHVVGGDPLDEDGLGLTALEDQMCLMAPSGYSGEGSPDRVDALVWAITELMLEPEGKRAGALW